MRSTTGCCHAVSWLLLVAAATLMFTVPVRGGELNICNVTASDNRTVTLQYLDTGSNVSVALMNTSRTVEMSLCTERKLSCGAAGFLLLLDEAGGCGAGSITFDAPLSSVSYNETTASASLELWASANSVAAMVSVLCDPGAANIVATEPVMRLNASAYYFAFASRTVCPGYTPPSSDDMLSRGAIVGIIIGFVAVVVIVSAVFQWKQKTAGDAYQSI